MGAMLDHVTQVLAKISDEKIDGALGVVASAGIPREYQDTSIDLMLERLRASRNTLNALIEEQYLETLPYRALSELGTHLSNIVASLDPLTQGQNTSQQLVERAEGLRTWMLRLGLRDREQGVASYEKRDLQAEALLATIQKLRRQLDNALKKAPQLDEVVLQASEAINQIQQHEQSALARSAAIAASTDEAATALTQVQERRDAISKALTDAQTRRDQTIQYSDEVNDLHSRAVSLRETMEEVESSTQSAMSQAKERADAIVLRLEEQQGTIDAALRGAVSVSLFHGFDERAQSLAKGKWRWLRFLAVALVTALVLGVWIALELARSPASAAFWAKLGIAPLAVFGIWFFSTQYARERHLEEVYAFKSKISVSLDAYRRLVAAVLAEAQAAGGEDESKSRYAEFVISAVDRVFTPPADHESPSKEADLTKLLTKEQLEDLAAAVLRVAVKGTKG